MERLNVLTAVMEQRKGYGLGRCESTDTGHTQNTGEQAYTHATAGDMETVMPGRVNTPRCGEGDVQLDKKRPSPLFEIDSPSDAVDNKDSHDSVSGGDHTTESAQPRDLTVEFTPMSEQSRLCRQQAAEDAAAEDASFSHEGTEQPQSQLRQQRQRRRRHGRDPPPRGPKLRFPSRGTVWQNHIIFSRANRHSRLALEPLEDECPQPELLGSKHHGASLPAVVRKHLRCEPLPRVKRRVNKTNGGPGATFTTNPVVDDNTSNADKATVDVSRFGTQKAASIVSAARRFGGDTEITEQDISCYARSVQEDFEIWCKVGDLRGSNVRFPPRNPAWRAVINRTASGQWAGNLNGPGGWPGALQRISQNHQQLLEATKRRHERVAKGQVATTIHGLRSVKSNSPMLGHAANLLQPRSQE